MTYRTSWTLRAGEDRAAEKVRPLRADECAWLAEARCGACGHLATLHADLEDDGCVVDCGCLGEQWQGPELPHMPTVDEALGRLLQAEFEQSVRDDIAALNADLFGKNWP